MAGYMLWSATHRRFGPCEITVEPCNDQRACCARCGGYLGHWTPHCACYSRGEIILPGPINSVVQILIDGVVVDPETYVVKDYAWLVNLEDIWPTCPADFVITYEIGLPPPPGAGHVAGELACELAKAFCNDDSCRLPRNITQAVRQGISVTYEAVLSSIPSMGLWVDLVNNPAGPGSVWSPDMQTVRQTTWTFDPGSSP